MNAAMFQNLINEGNWDALEDRWLTVLSEVDAPQEPMVTVLESLVKDGQAERAGTLAATWLESLGEQADEADRLALAKRLLLIVDHESLRQEAASLFQSVYADREGIDTLIEASGLAGAASPRRALRTLDLCLAVAPGSYLVSRTDDTPAEVVHANLARQEFQLKIKGGTKAVGADKLGIDYEQVSEDDFRVLTQLQPDAFEQMLRDDPGRVVIGVLHARGGEITADDLKYLLSPRYVGADEWSKWWSRLRTALKRHPHVRLEGRNPVVLCYDEKSQSVHDEAQERWRHARRAETFGAVIDQYIRDAKACKEPVDTGIIAVWHKKLVHHFERHRNTPSEALEWALLCDRLRHINGYSPPEPPVVEALLSASEDVVELLRPVARTSAMLPLIEMVRRVRAEDWVDVFVALLRYGSPNVEDALVGALVDAGHTGRVQGEIDRIALEPSNYVRVMAWLWCEPKHASVLTVPPRSELLTRMLTALSDLARAAAENTVELKDAREAVRAALSARKYAYFKEALHGMDVELARTLYRQIERTPGLSRAMVHDLTVTARSVFSDLFVERKVEPWEDENVLYTTEDGQRKAEAELVHLVNVKMAENAKAIGEAASHGDLSENSEYKFALEERDLLRARAAKIRGDLALARVLRPQMIPRDRISVGTRAVLRRVDGETRRELVFLGPWDADVERAVYNYKAPVSQQLMGCQVGETVTISLEGETADYQIEAVEPVI